MDTTKLNCRRWEELVRPADGAYCQGTLTPQTVFLFSSVTSPLPSGLYFGWWQWFDGAEDLVDYLRCAGLPDMLSEWFGSPDVSEGFTGPRVAPREILKWAREHDSRVEDIPVVEKVLDLLDHAAALSQGEALAVAQEACEVFTARFGSSPTYDLELRVFPDVQAAARQVAADGQLLSGGRDWVTLAASVSAGDAEAAETFADGLRTAEYY